MKKSLNMRAHTLFALMIFILSFNQAAFSAEIEWQTYENARALKSDKPIFVFGKMRFCGACKEMEKEVFTDNELATLLNEKFIPVKETINTAFSSFEFDDLKDADGNELEISGFPSLLVVQGERYSLSQGFMDKDQLLSVLNQVVKAN